MARRLKLTLGLCALVTATAAVPAVAATARAGPGDANAAANFVSHCRYSHRAPDDPIVKPNQPGAAHLHDFFANATTDAASTATTLLAGGTTCRRSLDTAAYWAPALSDGGRAIQPSTVAAYYLTGGKPAAGIQPFPAGLRVVAGPAPGTAQFACRVADKDVVTSRTAPPSCPAGSEFVVRIFFPDCWNGVDLDSADHRSHMAYSLGGRCPATHPVPVPRLRLGFHYPGADGGNDLTLSSGGPDTAHADFFNTWNQAELDRLVKACLNRGVKCAGQGPDRMKKR